MCNTVQYEIYLVLFPNIRHYNFLDQSNFFGSGLNNLCWCMVNVLYYHVLTTCNLIRKCLGTICMNYGIILDLKLEEKVKKGNSELADFFPN